MVGTASGQIHRPLAVDLDGRRTAPKWDHSWANDEPNESTCPFLAYDIAARKAVIPSLLWFHRPGGGYSTPGPWYHEGMGHRRQGEQIRSRQVGPGRPAFRGRGPRKYWHYAGSTNGVQPRCHRPGCRRHLRRDQPVACSPECEEALLEYALRTLAILLTPERVKERLDKAEHALDDFIEERIKYDTAMRSYYEDRTQHRSR